MTTYQTPGPRPQGHARREVNPRWPIAVAGLISLVTAVLGALWLWRPGWNTLADASGAVVGTLLGADRIPLVPLALGLLGATSAAIGTAYLSRPARPVPGWLGVVALVLAVGMASMPGMSIIALAGYSVALAMPVAMTLVVVQLVRRGGPGRWLALGATAAVVGGGMLLGILTRDSVQVYGEILPRVGPELVTMAAPLLMMAGAATWLLVALRAGRDAGVVDRPARWVLRHRRPITVVAAVCALPYALVRLTWLTPWKLYGFDDMPASTILWGLLLSTGAWAGFVLTLGLIQRWGEVFPRWMPFVAGRSVPVWFAAVPGGTIAAVVCVSAVPLPLGMAQATDSLPTALSSLIVFPFWLWGPTLAMAVWGYVLHRHGDHTAATVGTPASDTSARGSAPVLRP